MGHTPNELRHMPPGMIRKTTEVDNNRPHHSNTRPTTRRNSLGREYNQPSTNEKRMIKTQSKTTTTMRENSTWLASYGSHPNELWRMPPGKIRKTTEVNNNRPRHSNTRPTTRRNSLGRAYNQPTTNTKGMLKTKTTTAMHGNNTWLASYGPHPNELRHIPPGKIRKTTEVNNNWPQHSIKRPTARLNSLGRAYNNPPTNTKGNAKDKKQQPQCMKTTHD